MDIFGLCSVISVSLLLSVIDSASTQTNTGTTLPGTTVITTAKPLIVNKGEWKKVGGKEYYWTSPGVHTKNYKKDWYDASKWCRENGGELLIIETKEEADLVAPDFHFSGYTWIGLSDLDNDKKWTWKNGQDYKETDGIFVNEEDVAKNKQDDPFDIDFFYSYSRNRYTDQLCATIDTKVVFSADHNDSVIVRGKENCGAEKPFICERKPGNTTPKKETKPKPSSGRCPRGYFPSSPNSDKCYRLIGWPDVSSFSKIKRGRGFSYYRSRTAPWDSGKNLCKQDKSLYRPGIASIASLQEQVTLLSYSGTMRWPIVIGMRKISRNEKRLWNDNSKNAYNNFTAVVGRRYSYDRCTKIETGPDDFGTWSPIDCHWATTFGVACQAYKDKSKKSNVEDNGNTKCPKGYTPRWESCYKLITQKLNWEDAQARCEQDEGHLVSIHETDEQYHIWALGLETGSDIWIGLSIEDDGGEDKSYIWADGGHLIHNRWQDGKVPTSGDCVQLDDKTGHWKATGCNARLPSVCKYTKSGPLTTPAPGEGQCPIGWIKRGKHCYFFELKGYKSWLAASYECRKKATSASLLYIEDLAENQWILDTIKDLKEESSLSYFGTNTPWIGLYRSRQDKQIYWHGHNDTSLKYREWGFGEPMDKKDCAHIEVDRRGRWFMVPCTSSNDYICKMPQLPPPTPLPMIKGNCPGEKWVDYGPSCFLFLPDHMFTWAAAKKECSSYGSHSQPASIHNDNEARFIQDSMVSNLSLPMHQHYWIGLARGGQLAYHRSTTLSPISTTQMIYGVKMVAGYKKRSGNCYSKDIKDYYTSLRGCALRCNRDKSCTTFVYVEREDWTRETCYLKSSTCDDIDIIPVSSFWTYDKFSTSDGKKYEEELDELKKWGWMDGTMVSYTNWKEGYKGVKPKRRWYNEESLNDYDYIFDANNGPVDQGGRCTQVLSPDHKWEAVECNAELAGLVCRSDKVDKNGNAITTRPKTYDKEETVTDKSGKPVVGKQTQDGTKKPYEKEDSADHTNIGTIVGILAGLVGTVGLVILVICYKKGLICSKSPSADSKSFVRFSSDYPGSLQESGNVETVCPNGASSGVNPVFSATTDA